MIELKKSGTMFAWFLFLVLVSDDTTAATQQPIVRYQLNDFSVHSDSRSNGELAPNSGPSRSSSPGGESGLNDLDRLLDADVSNLRNTKVAPAFDVEVSTVSRQKSTVGKSPAAVFVIDQEMIRRSGARSLPELLRMVPGIHIGKINSGRWSVSSRGFIDDYNQQLLVQIDGRSVYTPIFGGVIWSWHDLLLDDIERIEVVRGPGSTIWGANAVNGVINVITKNAADTKGLFVEGGGGTEENGFAGVRVGGSSPNGVNWRISTKWFERDTGFSPLGTAFDDWRQGRVDMRLDWGDERADSYTLQGGLFTSEIGVGFQTPFVPLSTNDTPVSGANVLFRWTRHHHEKSDTSFQVWSDHYDSGNNFDLIHADQTSLDLDLQHRRQWRENHQVIAGVAFRNVWDRLLPTTGLGVVTFDPPERSFYNVSGFVQDEINLMDEELFLTIGTKLSHNSFTDFEVQPNIRLLRVFDEKSVGWCAFSRAVRVPTRTDLNAHVIIAPGFLTAFGNPDVKAEPMLSYELGFRRQPQKYFSWDANIYYHDYNDLVIFAPSSPTSLMAQNLQDVESYGAEISGTLDLTCNWKIRSWYSFQNLREKHALFNGLPVGSPRHQAFLMSTFQPTRNTDLDLMIRYVDDLRAADVNAYLQGDLRFAWRPNRNTEISIVGQNLFDSSHLESVGNPFVPEISTLPQRGIYGMVQLRY